MTAFAKAEAPPTFTVPIPAGHALHIKRSDDNLTAQIEVMRFLSPADAKQIQDATATIIRFRRKPTLRIVERALEEAK